MKNLIALVAFSLTIIACNKDDSKIDRALSFTNVLRKLNDTTLTVGFVRLGKDNKDYVVISTGNFYGVADLSDWKSSYDTKEEVFAYFDNHAVYNGIKYDQLTDSFICGVGCTDRNNTPVNLDMVFEKTSTRSKDLEKLIAFKEQFEAVELASTLSAQFGLSEERAIEISRLNTSWNKLSKSRALTDADADAFSRELAGVKMESIEQAYRKLNEGSSEAMNELIEIAAEKNGTTPEHMAEILSAFL